MKKQIGKYFRKPSLTSFLSNVCSTSQRTCLSNPRHHSRHRNISPYDLCQQIPKVLPQHILNCISQKRRFYRQYVRTYDLVIKTEWNSVNALIKLQIDHHKQQQQINTTSNLDFKQGSKWNPTCLSNRSKHGLRRTLKTLPETMFPILASLLNTCVSLSYVSLVWKSATQFNFPNQARTPNP